MTIYVGIDPGREGAIAMLWEKAWPGTCDIFDLPYIGKDLDLQRLKSYFPSGNLRAVIEQAQVMPRQGSVSGFTIGYGFGQLTGLLLGMGIPFETVRPAIWKKAMGIPAKSDKSVSVQMARRLFPSAELVTARGRLLDGRAEALLLATWLQRRERAAEAMAASDEETV